MSLSPLRRLPALTALSSASSLLLVVPDGDLRTVTASVVCVSGLALLLSLWKRKAWSLRTLSAVLSGGSIGALVTERPDYIAVLGALLPLCFIVLIYGPPFAVTKPASGVARRHHPPSKMLGALDSYLLLAQAVVYQFTAQNEFGVVLFSFVLSALAVLTIALVAADVGIDAARRALRVIGLASQVYLAIVDETEPGVRALAGVVCGIYAIPATV